MNDVHVPLYVNVRTDIILKRYYPYNPHSKLLLMRKKKENTEREYIEIINVKKSFIDDMFDYV